MAVRPGIPLGQHDQGAAVVFGRAEPQGMDDIVLRVGRFHRAGEGQPAAVQVVIGDRRIGVEAVGIGQGLVDKPRHAGGAVAVHFGRAERKPELVEPVSAPFERPNHPIGVPRRELALPAVHPSRVESRHVVGRVSVPDGKKARARADGFGRGA